MFALADMMKLLSHELACLSGGRFSCSSIFSGAFQCFFFRHNSSFSCLMCQRIPYQLEAWEIAGQWKPLVLANCETFLAKRSESEPGSDIFDAARISLFGMAKARSSASAADDGRRRPSIYHQPAAILMQEFASRRRLRDGARLHLNEAAGLARH